MDKIFKLTKLEDSEFDLKHDYERIRIEGLTHIFPGSTKFPTSDTSYSVGGAIALLRSEKHPGCCQLLYSWRGYEDDTLVEKFYPAYTADGDKIYVEYNHDCIFCMLNTGLTESDQKMYREMGVEKELNATIVFLKDAGIDV